MVKRRWAFIATLSLVATSYAMNAPAAEKASAFGPGEQSTYAVQYLGVTAGTAQITVGAETTQWGAKVWPIVTLANTDSLMVLYPVRDKFVTYWEHSKHRTVGTDLFADEGRKKRRERTKYDHAKKIAHVMKHKEGEDPTEKSVEITPGSADVAAAAFALRNQELAVGRTFELPVFTGKKSFTLKAHVEGTEKMKTPLGERDVFRIRVQTAFSGKFESKRDLYAYLTTDRTHVPVRIEAEFILGKIVAELTDYKPGRVVAARPSLAKEG